MPLEFERIVIKRAALGPVSLYVQEEVAGMVRMALLGSLNECEYMLSRRGEIFFRKYSMIDSDALAVHPTIGKSIFSYFHGFINLRKLGNVIASFCHQIPPIVPHLPYGFSLLWISSVQVMAGCAKWCGIVECVITSISLRFQVMNLDEWFVAYAASVS